MRLVRALAVGTIAVVAVTACGTATSSPSAPGSSGAPAVTAGPSAGGAGSGAAVYSDGDTVTVVVPYNAGGGYDVSTRLLAPCFETAIRDASGAAVTVVVQNVTGASGQIGTNQVFGAEPDGTQILMNAIDIMVPQQIVEDAEFDVAAFTPIARFASNGRSMIIRSDVLPADADFTDLVARSQQEPVLIGGAGLQNQIAMMQLLLAEAGTPINLSLVEFEGTGEGVASMLRGELEVYLVGSDGAIETVEASPDEIRVLTIFNDEDPLRDQIEAPSLTESNVPNGAEIGLISGTNNRAFFGPPGMADEVTSLLNGALQTAMADATCAAPIADSGAVVTYGDAAAVADAVLGTTEIYTKYADQLPS